MLKIFLEVTTCLEVTTFLGITNSSKATSLLGMTIFLFDVACSARNTYVKGIDTQDVCTEGASIKAAYTKDIYIRDALTCASDAYIWIASIKDTCIRDTGVMKYLKILLQLS